MSHHQDHRTHTHRSRGQGSRTTFSRAIRLPTSIDPYRAQEAEGIAVTQLLFTGLLTVDDQGHLCPALAHRVEPDAENLRWVFHLTPGTTFSNGEPVTAHSFVRGWNRALTAPQTTETAYHLAGIRGFTELQAGTAGQLSGAYAADDVTLVVELAQPDSQFAHKTLQPIFSPVPACAGAAGDREFARRPIGNGPFAFAPGTPDRHQWHLVRNPRYPGPRPAVSALSIDVLETPDASEVEFAGFADGTYDYARVPPHELATAHTRYAPTGQFVERDLAGVYYLIPFVHRPPLDSLDARRAVSCALDREWLCATLFHGRKVPATSLVPPFFRETHQSGLLGQFGTFAPARAREHAARAGMPPGSVVDFAYDTGAGHDDWVTAVARQLTDVLGWQVRQLAMSPAELVAHRTSPDATGLCRAAWLCDYPTPDNVLFPLLHSSCTAPDRDGVAHGDNEGRYADEDFDRLVAQARAAPTQETRVALWQAAERLAIGRDLALLPLWHGRAHALRSAHRVPGLTLDFFGNPALTSPDLAGEQ